MRNLAVRVAGVEIFADQLDVACDALRCEAPPVEGIAAEQRVKMAIKRSEALFNFYSAERRAGADPLTANERMNEFAKRLDALPEQYEAELEITRQIMRSVK